MRSKTCNISEAVQDKTKVTMTTNGKSFLLRNVFCDKVARLTWALDSCCSSVVKINPLCLCRGEAVEDGVIWYRKLSHQMTLTTQLMLAGVDDVTRDVTGMTSHVTSPVVRTTCVN